MIALGGPKLKLLEVNDMGNARTVSMIALGGPKLKLKVMAKEMDIPVSFNDSTGWA